MSSATEKLGDLAQSAAIVFAGTIVGRALGLLGEAAIIRSLEPSAFGGVSLAYTVVFASGTLAVFGLRDGMTRLFSAGDETESRDLVRAGLLLALITGIIGATTVYLLRNHIAAFMSTPELAGLLGPFALFILLFPLSRVLFGVIRGLGSSNMGIVAKNLGPRIIALVAFAVATVTIGATNAAVVYWVSLPAVLLVIAGGYVCYQFGPRKLLLRTPSVEKVRNLWSFSWPLAVGSVVFLFLAQLDVLMLGYLSDTTAVGYYRSIQPLKQVATFVMNSFTFLFLPLATQFYENDQLSELEEIYTVSTKWIAALTLPMVLVFSLFAGSVVTVFFGARYAPAAPALTVLVLGLIVRSLVGLNGDMVRAIDRPRIEALTAVPGLAVNAVCNLLLIPRLGIVGAAIATVLGYTVYNLGEVIAIYRHTGIHPFSGRLIRQQIPTAVVAVGCRLALGPEVVGIVGLLGLGILFATVQVFSTVLTRSLTPADLVLINRLEEVSGRSFPRVRERLTEYS